MYPTITYILESHCAANLWYFAIWAYFDKAFEAAKKMTYVPEFDEAEIRGRGC